MKFQGPSLVWALGAAVVIYYLFFRNAPPASARQPEAPAAGSSPNISGAPVPDLGTSLAVTQNSLLGQIFSYFNGSAPSSSTPGSVTAAGGVTTGTAPSSNAGLVNGESSTQEIGLANQRAEGSLFPQVPNDLGFGPSNPFGPANSHASSGFGSDNFKYLQALDLAASLNDLASSGGGGGGGSPVQIQLENND